VLYRLVPVVWCMEELFLRMNEMRTMYNPSNRNKQAVFLIISTIPYSGNQERARQQGRGQKRKYDRILHLSSKLLATVAT
jgi:hypothetical protein